MQSEDFRREVSAITAETGLRKHPPENNLAWIPAEFSLGEIAASSTEETCTGRSMTGGLYLAERKQAFKRRFLQEIEYSEFEYGSESRADRFLSEWLDGPESSLIREAIGEVFIEEFGNADLASKILRVLAHMKFEAVHPVGQTIAIGGLSHKSVEVRDCAIGALENWGPSSLPILENIHCSEPWLADYLRRVIRDLRELVSDVSRPDV